MKEDQRKQGVTIRKKEIVMNMGIMKGEEIQKIKEGRGEERGVRQEVDRQKKIYMKAKKEERNFIQE